MIDGRACRRHTLLAGLALGSACGTESAPTSLEPVPSGTFDLRRIDGSALPVPVALASMERTVDVNWGELMLVVPGSLKLSFSGPVGNGVNSAVSAQFPYAFRRPDSLVGQSVRGRVWGDSAEIVTTGGEFGDHRWLFVKVVPP